MIKLFSLLILSFLVLNVQVASAKELTGNQETNSNYNYSDEDFNFNDNSFNISDEQLQQEPKKSDEIEEKQSFSTRIINSSHFSSGTATKTYIPVNKVK